MATTLSWSFPKQNISTSSASTRPELGNSFSEKKNKYYIPSHSLSFLSIYTHTFAWLRVGGEKNIYNIPALKIFPSRWQHLLDRPSKIIPTTTNDHWRWFLSLFFSISKLPLLLQSKLLDGQEWYTFIDQLWERRAGRWLSNRSAWCVVKHATWPSTFSSLLLPPTSPRFQTGHQAMTVCSPYKAIRSCCPIWFLSV